jgi:hypothetical protein
MLVVTDDYVGKANLQHLGPDWRHLQWCPYCGVTLTAENSSQDHVPSKVFLDKPYPEHLPTICCCRDCNNSFAQAEQYLSCFLDCVLHGSTSPEAGLRPSTVGAFREVPALKDAIEDARRDDGWMLDADHAHVVAVKLARGHVSWWLNEPRLEDPTGVSLQALASLDESTRDAFENVPQNFDLLPEVGTRALHDIFSIHGDPEEPALAPGGWREVQEGRYRFFAFQNNAVVLVRFVIAEALAGEVYWDTTW